MPSEVRHLSVTIAAPFEAAYAYLAEPTNFPEWAAGLGSGFRRIDGMRYVAQSPMGEIEILFTARNAFGVLDHTVLLPSGEANFNPMRVVPNGNGCEVTFALFRRALDDAAYTRDEAAVRRDLEALKGLLETRLRA